MSDSIILITDVHGCFFTLSRLLAKCAAKYPGAQLILLGDLIDRGPHSRLVVEFAMRNRIPTVIGNHEDLAIAYSEHRERGYKPFCGGYYDRDVWLWNGGEDTQNNWPGQIPDDVLNWMAALPPYIVPEAAPDSMGRLLLVSHTGYGLEVHKGTPEGWFRALWGRHGLDSPNFPDDGYYRVFGHTQQREAVVTDTYAMIDTGAAYSGRGMGRLTAFIWPTREIVEQAFDEREVKMRVGVEDGRIAA